MAKQSAKSKGYRKTVKKKPFLTKKEIIELIVIVAVIVLGVVLFNLFYDDGFIGESDLQPGDVVAFASREARSRFAKVGVANELDGFTRSDPDFSVNPTSPYVFTPDADTDHIDSIHVNGSYVPASQLAESSATQMASLADSLEATPAQAIDVQGHDAYVYSYTMDYYQAPEEEAAEEEPAEEEEAPAEEEEAPAEEEAAAEEEATAEEGSDEEQPSNVFSQALCCYVDVDGYTLCFDIYRNGEDDSFYLPEDQIADYLLKYTDAFTVVDR